MKGVKQQVINMIKALPEEITVDDIIAELYFMKQVDDSSKKFEDLKISDLFKSPAQLSISCFP